MRTNTQPCFIDYTQTRIQLLVHGISMRGWAAKHGYEQSSVYRAVKLGHVGKVSNEIRAKLRKDCRRASEK